MPTPQFTWEPDSGSWEVDYDGPDTLTTVFLDKSVQIREPFATSKRILSGTITETASEWREIMNQFDIVRLVHPLTIYIYDPQGLDPLNDLGLVRYIAKPTPRHAGGDATGLWRARVQFREV